jgi:DNA polymerase III epsilon subunit-like protein
MPGTTHMLPTAVVFFDLEGTAKDPRGAAIVEIGAVSQSDAKVRILPLARQTARYSLIAEQGN